MYFARLPLFRTSCHRLAPCFLSVRIIDLGKEMCVCVGGQTDNLSADIHADIHMPIGSQSADILLYIHLYKQICFLLADKFLVFAIWCLDTFSTG